MPDLALPNNIGQSVAIEHKDGSRRYYTVIDEIVYIVPDSPNRVLCAQRLRYRKTNITQIRFCYYLADEVGWVLVQHTACIPEPDFQAIVREAIQRGWIEL